MSDNEAAKDACLEDIQELIEYIEDNYAENNFEELKENAEALVETIEEYLEYEKEECPDTIKETKVDYGVN